MSRRNDRRTTSYPGVERVGKGEFRIRGKYIHPKTDRRRELDRVVKAKSAREAAQERDRLLRRATATNMAAETRFKEYAASWYAGKLPKLKASTRVQYASALDLHIVPYFGDWFVDRIAHEDVVRWRDSMSDGAHSINGRLRLLRGMMEDAKHILGLRLNPARRVELLKTGPKKDKTLTPDELRKLLAAVKAETPQWYPLVLVLAHTGARFGEASALEWKDIDWDAMSVRLERAHVRGAVDTVKVNDPRTVPVTDEMAEVLKAHRAKTGDFRLVFPADVDDPATARNHGYSQPSCLSKPLAKARRKAGIAKHVSPHWFRHSWNNLLRQTADRETQQALTGHSTEEMSMHYASVSLGEKRMAVARVLELVTKGGG